MNYYEPLKRVDGRWDYTRNGRPTGYCCEYKEIDPNIIHVDDSIHEEYRATSHKHHTDGHATEAEACECYKEYILDHKLRYSKMSNQQLKCRVCGEWTQHYADLGCETLSLCEDHLNREEVAKLYGNPTWSMSSW